MEVSTEEGSGGECRFADGLGSVSGICGSALRESTTLHYCRSPIVGIGTAPPCRPYQIADGIATGRNPVVPPRLPVTEALRAVSSLGLRARLPAALFCCGLRRLLCQFAGQTFTPNGWKYVVATIDSATASLDNSLQSAGANRLFLSSFQWTEIEAPRSGETRVMKRSALPSFRLPFCLPGDFLLTLPLQSPTT
jgi:hypothetical protein